MSALQRHTMNGGLVRLSAEERQVITLAYLEGRTNRQIAYMLGVSVSTVRRRLLVALERLEEYVRRTGTWVSSILLLGLAYVIGRTARLGRLANAIGSADWSDKLAAALAVSAVTMAAFGVVAANSHSSTSKQSPPAATARLIPTVASVDEPSAAPSNLVPFGPNTSAVPPEPRAGVKGAGNQTDQAAGTGDGTSSRGCHGNPTSAPPIVPVGSPTSHPTGAPVTHPTSGGCPAISS